MRDRIGVPAFGQHRDGDDAADGFAESARFADGVHHLAQKIGVRNRLGYGAGTVERCFISYLNCSISGPAISRNCGIERIAGFELFAVYE